MKKYVFFFLLAFIFLFSFLKAQTILNQLDTIEIVMDNGKGMDATTASIDPFTNYDWEEKIQAYAWTQGGILNVTRVFLQFDMTGVPSNAIVTEAYLILHDTPIMTHSGINDCYVKRVTGPWNSTTINHVNQPSVSNVDQAYIPETTSQTLFNIDVTNITQYIISNPSENYGFRISLVDESPLRRMCFSASECTDQTKRPKLMIVYSPNVGVDNYSINQCEIYPNPATNQMQIRRIDESKPAHIKVYSILGQLLYEDYQYTSSKSIEVSELENGIYMVNISQGNAEMTKKFVIKR